MKIYAAIYVSENYISSCPRRISVRIKKDTKKTRETDKLVTSHPCVMTLEGQHSHNVDVLNYTCQRSADVQSWAALFTNKDATMHLKLDTATAQEFTQLLKIVQKEAKVNFVTKAMHFNPKKYEWCKAYVSPWWSLQNQKMWGREHLIAK